MPASPAPSPTNSPAGAAEPASPPSASASARVSHSSSNAERRHRPREGPTPPRERSMVTLTALVAHGHLEELAMHMRAARRNGLTVEEIGAVLSRVGVHCGVPAANSAFAVAQRVLSEGP
ncbi:carboxymuconolactone decarboxylase family protein [Streptomyces sp. B3I7]|uniref:carboxymuconolactone decarboxylase family protein n=1 Tax=Streptomyces sp. B3I7 TaxID=3042269 RepID=UPI0027D8471A|nr:carboxymuconolactone decarboxylase family protein [Streptomyces sp. B3I7]